MAYRDKEGKLRHHRRFLNPGLLARLLVILVLLLQIAAIIVGIVFVLKETLNETNRVYAVVSIFILDVVFCGWIINNKSDPVYKIAWMFFVVVLPIFGCVLYLFFANKATTRGQKKKYLKWSKYVQYHKTDADVKEEMGKAYPPILPLNQYLEQTCGGAAYDHTSAHYYSLGDYAFEDILKDLRSAKHYIFLEFFIIAPGKFWDSMLEILIQKANEGVDVRMLYDDVGSVSTVPMGYANYLRSQGIKAYVFEPIRPLLDIRQNNRDHRKILVVDGHTAYTGGCNLADEYINVKSRFGHWKDNFVRIQGEAVYGFTTMFLSNWLSVSNLTDVNPIDYYRYDHFLPEGFVLPETDGYFQPYPDLPYDHNSVGEHVYVSLLGMAKKTVDISTPYLILNSRLSNALIDTAKSGVRVRLLIPHIPDKPAVFQISRSYYGDLVKAGVEIYEYTPGFVHEKVFLIDGEIATIGTFNLDYRSLVFHLECGLMVIKSSIVSDIQKDFDETFEKCERIEYPRWHRWHMRNMFYWAVLRIVSPLL